MIVTRDRRELPPPPPGGSVVSVGVFDGVHLGHQAVLAANVARARALGARPTVVTRFSTGSCTAVCVETGDVSVMPQAIVTSSMCIDVRTCLIVSTGQGAPAMIPVRRLVRSNWSKRGSSSTAMNIVGTP